MRRGLLLVAAAVFLMLAVACGSDDPPDPAGAAIAERWLRLGEDAQTSIRVYERQLPPNLVELLNPTATADTAADDLLAFPVHPDGELVGSYVMRRVDGTNLVWLIYDVMSDEREIEPVIFDQLDESPWQVTGMQANPSLSVIRFQTTMIGDVDGSAFIQPNPGTATFSLTIDRDGAEQTLEVARGAHIPIIEAGIEDDLEVRRVDVGAARIAGLREGDRIVAVQGAPVANRRELSVALGDLARTGELSTSVTYIITIQQPALPDDEIFVEPPGRQLPPRFPAAAVWDPFTVLDYAWVAVPGGRAYQAGMITLASPTETANRVRDGLEDAGWEILDDRAQGFATILDFAHLDEGLIGTASIDTFPPDEDYALVILELQTGAP